MVWVGAGAVFRASRWLWSTKATRLTEECMNMTAVNHAIAFPVQWRSKKKSVWTNKNQLLTRSLDSDSHLEPFLSFTFSHCLLWFSHTVWFRFKHQNCLAKKKGWWFGCQMSKKQKTKDNVSHSKQMYLRKIYQAEMFSRNPCCYRRSCCLRLYFGLDLCSTRMGWFHSNHRPPISPPLPKYLGCCVKWK